jgi:hypothetical protein
MMLELYDLWAHGKDDGEFFRECIAKNQITPDMGRSTIRDLIKLGKTKEQAREDRRRAAMSDPDCQTGKSIVTGDMGLLYDLLADDSVQVFATDPPWDHGSIPLYGRIAELAAQKLKPGGLLITYVGHFYSYEVETELRKHLTFHWECGVHFPYKKAPIYPKQVASCWAKILIFQKPPVTKLPNMIIEFDHLNWPSLIV